MGTWDAGLDRFDPKSGVFTHFPHVPTDPSSLSDNAVMTLDPGRNGALWVGTMAGVDRIALDTGTITHYPLDLQTQSNSGSTTVSAIHEDRNGAIWVATYNDGLYQLNPDGSVARRYSQKDGLPSDAVFAILEDSRGLLWLSTNNGLVPVRSQRSNLSQF